MKTRTSLFAMTVALGLAVLPWLSPAPAGSAQRISSCTFTVGAKTYISGPCDYEDLGGGDFMITDPKLLIACDKDNNNKPDASDDCAGAEERVFRKGAFVYVTLDGKNSATANWNELSGTHAHTSLGVVKRSGACWSNSRTKICARK